MNDVIKERQKKLVELFSKAPIKKTFGMELSFDDKGSAVFIMPYNPGFDHALNQIHGGVLATLLDNAGWFTVASNYSTWVGTAEMQMRILEPVAKKTLLAKGAMIKKGKKMAMAEMRVETEDGELIALGTGTFAITSVPY